MHKIPQSKLAQMGKAAALKNRTLPTGQATAAYTDEWYSPPALVSSLGGFDLDPCAGPMGHAAVNIRRPDCGLSMAWRGRVWLNPPYSGLVTWLERMLEHGSGIALVNARTETQWFQHVAAHVPGGLLMAKRVRFISPTGKCGHHPIGSILFAFSEADYALLGHCGIPGLLTRFESAKLKTEN